MEFISLPSSLAGWLAFIAIDIAGVFALAGLFDRQRRERNKQLNEADDRLIDLLQKQVDVLQGKVDESDSRLREMEKQFEALKVENHTLKEILMGRDKVSTKYQEEGLRAMKRTEEILEISKQTSVNIERLAQAIEKHLDSDYRKIEINTNK